MDYVAVGTSVRCEEIWPEPWEVGESDGVGRPWPRGQVTGWLYGAVGLDRRPRAQSAAGQCSGARAQGSPGIRNGGQRRREEIEGPTLRSPMPCMPRSPVQPFNRNSDSGSRQKCHRALLRHLEHN